MAEDFRRANPKGTFHAAKSWQDLVEYMGDARVAINDTVNLGQAMLIRFFYPMAVGCLVATEVNDFVNREFRDGENVIGLVPDDPANGERVRAVLENPERAQDMADAATATYAAGHTWSHRVEALRSHLVG